MINAFHAYSLMCCMINDEFSNDILFTKIEKFVLKEILDDNHHHHRDKPCMFATSLKPFDLSEATKLSLVLSASQQISQQQLKDSFMKNFSRYATSDFEDTDSRFSFSSSSSPTQVSFSSALKC